MKTKILMTMLILIIAASMVVGGTLAVFFDSEAVEDNTFAAGKLDLVFDSSASIPFNSTGLAPGDSGQGKIRITNAAGSLDGILDIAFANVWNLENGIVEPESQPIPGKTVDYENGPGAGELKFFLHFAAYVDVDKDGTFDAGDIQLTYNGQKAAHPGFWSGVFNYHPADSMAALPWTNIMTLAGGQSVDLVVMWRYLEDSPDANYHINISMTDSLGFDINAVLNQAN